jgi:hypothetical protein
LEPEKQSRMMISLRLAVGTRNDDLHEPKLSRARDRPSVS